MTLSRATAPPDRAGLTAIDHLLALLAQALVFPAIGLQAAPVTHVRLGLSLMLASHSWSGVTRRMVEALSGGRG